MSFLFIKDAMSLSETTNIMNEDLDKVQEKFIDSIDNFINIVERRLKGYSFGEIDSLAKKAKNINSEVKKRETLKQIEDATKKAQESLKTTNDDDKKHELRLQLQSLSELKNKVNSFHVVEDPKEEKDDRIEGSPSNHRIINLDEY